MAEMMLDHKEWMMEGGTPAKPQGRKGLEAQEGSQRWERELGVKACIPLPASVVPHTL